MRHTPSQTRTRGTTCSAPAGEEGAAGESESLAGKCPRSLSLPLSCITAFSILDCVRNACPLRQPAAPNVRSRVGCSSLRTGDGDGGAPVEGWGWLVQAGRLPGS
eukprot:scaffold284_cov15-Tisochrysis_lutea.AAC.4